MNKLPYTAILENKLNLLEKDSKILIPKNLESVPKVLHYMEKVALEYNLPIIGPGKRKIISSLFKRHKPHYVIEIGTLFGYSSISMANSMPKNSKIITIEINKTAANIAKQNIRRVGFENVIEVLQGNAIDVIPNLEGSFDAILIDGVKDEYLLYLKSLEAKLHKGSLVIADNVKIFFNEMQDYLNYVRNSGKYKNKYIEAPLFGGSKIYSDGMGNDAIEVSVKIGEYFNDNKIQLLV